MSLMTLTAVELGKKIKAKEVTVVEATRAALDAIKEKEESEFYKKDIDFYREACENAFSYDEMRLIFEIIVQMQMPPHQFGEKIARFHYLSEKYAMLKLVSARTPIKNKVAYFLAMINNDRKKQQES